MITPNHSTEYDSQRVQHGSRSDVTTRIDYVNDANAPRPNSVRPAASVIVAADDGKILMIKRRDNDLYSLPGGVMEIGESLTDTAIRECREETGYQIRVTGLLGVFTDPNHVIHYLSNNEIRQEFAVVYLAESEGLVGDHDLEASKVEWVDPRNFNNLNASLSTRHRIAVFLTGEAPHFDKPTREPEV